METRLVVAGTIPNAGGTVVPFVAVMAAVRRSRAPAAVVSATMFASGSAVIVLLVSPVVIVSLLAVAIMLAVVTAVAPGAALAAATMRLPRP